MKVAIVKYNAGNVCSVVNALERLGVNPIITDNPEELKTADKVIFPGVGEASSAMKYLREKGLNHVLVELKQPLLGICLGMQLMCSHSEEGDVKGLGIFETKVKRFEPKLKVPHVGWNRISSKVEDSLLEGLDNPYLYYVHSFYAELSSETIATTDYVLPFSAILKKDNFYAIQAHPEKSGTDGELLLKNFINL